MSKDKKYSSVEVAKFIKRFASITDDKLKDIYSNIDWDDFIFLDVG